MTKLEKLGGIIALQYEWKLNYVTETTIAFKGDQVKEERFVSSRIEEAV